MVAYWCRLANKSSLQNYATLRKYSLKGFDMESPIVNTKLGKLRGRVKELFDGSKYYSFKGIRYGQPPLRDLRFKAPLPVKPWEGIYDAVRHGPISPQFDAQTKQINEGSEDCLFLNVYSKSLDPETKSPVMVFIHGGGFVSGSGNSDIYGPEFLIQQNVVLVTINYRLELFGFLCLDIPEVPGNAGLKDQVLALRWIQNNITSFGGDAGNVTIFGESAGAASVTYHMVSPKSRGLFHKVIAQSGVCTADWAQSINLKERSLKVCKALGKETTNPTEALQFLQSVPARDLVNKNFMTKTSDEKHRGLPIYFGPTVEQNFGDNAHFLLENPENLILQNNIKKVPLMIGYTSKEGIITLGIELRKLEYRKKNPSSYVPREIYLTVSENKLKEFGERIKKFYFGDEIREEDSEKICDLQSDLYFTYPPQRFLQLYSRYKQPIYMYRFNHDTELNFFKNIMGGSEIKGACHVDELFYLFCNTVNRDYYREDEKLRNIIDTVVQLWTDFAKTGNPTSSSSIKWDPYTWENKEYLNIDEDMVLGKYADKHRVEFWYKLYREAGLHIKSNL
ncbi:unnamed protein product [Leptosia nina]|uniref:Carboxylic ester hydrolase n=1 Tax=Leptosia nina TaxID=320188 RepID=A0AAV1JSG6_9NEOP